MRPARQTPDELTPPERVPDRPNMTFCIAIKVQQGLVALADTRIVKGDERLSKGKLTTLALRDRPLFLMTSGLRSVRDKTYLYLQQTLTADGDGVRRLYQVANLFGEQLRRVRGEDEAELTRGGLSFNLHAVIGGRLEDDAEPSLFYLYPQGNWIETAVDSPYFMLGRTPYGRPLIDRLLRYDTPLPAALNLALLAFDATRSSVTDVDFPIDLLTLEDGSVRQRRFDAGALAEVCAGWRQQLERALYQLPAAWTRPLLSESSSDLHPFRGNPS